MLHLNPLIIPDPDCPEAMDAYGFERPELIVYAVNEISGGRAGRLSITCAFRGSAISMPEGMLPAFVASIGVRPLGRLERRARGVKPRPEDFDLATAVNDLGPRLRALREATGLRLGDLARALRCSTSQLSRVELGEWKPGPPNTALSQAELDAMHPAGRCSCGAGGAGGTCEWCLAGIAIGALVDAFDQAGFSAVLVFREWLQHDGIRGLVATELAPHVGSNEREVNADCSERSGVAQRMARNAEAEIAAGAGSIVSTRPVPGGTLEMCLTFIPSAPSTSS